MLTLLIVDDEPSTRDGLAEYYDWSAHGITRIYTAEDGESALSIFENARIDIVLTDVKMPGMDGIQLAERIRRNRRDVQIVFISGHDDVAFMKSALKVDAVDYIMKPINMRELAAVVEESVRHILRERERYRLMTDMNAQLSQSLPLLREKFWLRAIRDGIEPTGNLGEQLSFLGIDLALAGKYCVFVIGVDDWSAVLESMSERDRQLISFALLNISQEIVDRTYRGYAFEHRQGEFVCVLALSTEADEDGLYATLNEIRQTVADLLKLSVTIGIGRPVSELRQLPSSYDMAMEALGQKLILGKNRIIMIDRVQDDADPYYRLHPQQVAQLTSCVRAGNAEQTARLLDALYEELIGRPQSTLRHFQKLYLQLLLIGSNALIGTSGYGDDPSTDENRLWAELSKLETAEDMHRLLIDYFMRACEIGREKRNDKSRSVIEDIKRIVEEQYGDPELTIQRIADRIYLTSTYVSLIFKQETGQTVNEYLTHVRMEHAKRLLTQTRNKLYDISEAVGYTDGSYFTKQFKKQTGLTPKEFRERPI